MSKSIAIAITDCGDLAVLLPMALVLALVLWRFESRAAALAWVWALAFCTVATLLLKIGFLTCSRAWGLNIGSPSGHTSMSTAVYGALAIVIATQLPRWRSWVALSSVLLIGSIAMTRTALHFHSTAEVEIGLAVGLASLCVFAWRYRRLSHPTFNVPWIGVGAVCVFALLYGVRLPAESFLYWFAHTMRTQTHDCHPFGGEDTKRQFTHPKASRAAPGVMKSLRSSLLEDK